MEIDKILDDMFEKVGPNFYRVDKHIYCNSGCTLLNFVLKRILLCWHAWLLETKK